MNQIAIIGPTASGKSALAVELALTCNAVIFSIDSLSIYREIDIASAKPTLKEQNGIPHYGIDLLNPDEPFNVAALIRHYQLCAEEARRNNRNIILVGGSSFYLKSLLSGLSAMPDIDASTLNRAKEMLHDLQACHALLNQMDPEYMRRIDPNDRYRIEKMLHLYLQTGMIPSRWFALHPPQPSIEHLSVFDLHVARENLRERIAERTRMMFASGLIDEVCALEQRYGRAPNSMHAIGILEVFAYLDGLTCKEETIRSIITHTSQLAKRQQTFNAHQFTLTLKAPQAPLYEAARRKLLDD